MSYYCVKDAMTYIIYCGSVLPTLKSQNKWRIDMNLPDNFGWKYVYELPFFLTKDSMFQWFQYRIKHRILGTNRLMFKMGIVSIALFLSERCYASTFQLTFCLPLLLYTKLALYLLFLFLVAFCCFFFFSFLYLFTVIQTHTVKT